MLRWARVGLPRRGRLLRGVGIVAVVAIGMATLVLAAMPLSSSASANAASVTSAPTATAGPSAATAHVAGPSAIAAAPTASTPVAAPRLPAVTGSPAAGSPTASGLVTTPGAATSAVPAAAAPAPPAQSADTVHRLPSGRTYQLHADVRLSPTFRGTGRPLVILLHGLLNTPENMREMSGADPFADTHGFAVAYGVGVHEAWNAGGCCGQATTDDVGYLRQLVDDAASHTPVDRSRVYVWGFSNGAMLAARVACEAPDLVAAVGMVGGQAMVSCPTVPVRLLHIHGTADTTVPWHGGWSDYLKMNLPDGETEATRFAPGSEIRHLTWDGGHAWPWWATSALWDFSAPVSLNSVLPDTAAPPATSPPATSPPATSPPATSPGNTAIPSMSASLSASTTPAGPVTTSAATTSAAPNGWATPGGSLVPDGSAAVDVSAAPDILVPPDEGP